MIANFVVSLVVGLLGRDFVWWYALIFATGLVLITTFIDEIGLRRRLAKFQKHIEREAGQNAVKGFRQLLGHADDADRRSRLFALAVLILQILMCFLFVMVGGWLRRWL